MAENLLVSPAEGGLREVTHEENNVDFSTGSEAAITVDGLRRIDSIADVSATGYGTGDANANEGRVLVPVSVSGNTVTLHSYQGGGAGAPLDNDTESDVDHVLIKARGY